MQENKPKIGLALGSGGARGLAHIGVLEVLEEENIDIDFIAGTSMGSIVGGLYACGIPLNYLKGLAEELDWDKISDITFPKTGLIKGNKLLQLFELLTQNKEFNDLNIPFAAIACDIEHGKHIVLNEGSVAKAIRSSSAIPGVFVPFKHKGYWLVDGAVLDRVPVSTVRNMGADLTIAVDIRIDEVNSEVNNIFDVLFNTFDILQYELKKLKNLEADISIEPDLEEITAFDLEKTEMCVDAGYRAARDSIKEIKNKIRRVSNEQK